MGILIGFITVVGLGIVIALLMAFPFMWLWNWLMPAIFKLPPVSFWQSLGLLIMASFLGYSANSEERVNGRTK